MILSCRPRGRGGKRPCALAHAINAAQVIITSPAPGRYRPLAELRNIPATPSGFELSFHTDGATYLFRVKDTLDACHYAIFSDQDKRVYEATPRVGGIVLPVRTD